MKYMNRALQLATMAVHPISPNPAVGVVIVNGGAVVGEGCTQTPGKPHAEIMALRQAGDRAAGGILYTTLEPCNHFGRTPPCTQAIVEAGLSEIYIATVDPNPLVNGSGISRLKEAGLRTHVGEGEKEARKLMEAHIKFTSTGIPFVTAKFAMSLDGKIATYTGDSKWITCELARDYVHRLRSQTDAIMVGINTVFADDPQLTARNEQGTPRKRQPLRVLVDSQGRLPLNSRLLTQPGQTLVAVANDNSATHRRLTQAGVEVAHVPSEDGRVDLFELLRILGRREVISVLVEGGSILHGELFDRNLVDKVVAFISPMIVGGAKAYSPVAGIGIETISAANRLHSVHLEHFGTDIAIIGYCEGKGDVHRNN